MFGVYWHCFKGLDFVSRLEFDSARSELTGVSEEHLYLCCVIVFQ
uniref:Uncharacterized protein n=1 Tax=Rhizophora mucronata TaxID=61149 RepID=A0A2P2PEV3_RHIMU